MEQSIIQIKDGGCHCGKIRFKVTADFSKGILCNCSICRLKGFVHLMVPKEAFEFLGNWEDLTCYQFGTKTAKHYFCNACGIAAFYVPRSHPDGFDINLRCVDDINWSQLGITHFDGQNWEAHFQEIEGI